MEPIIVVRPNRTRFGHKIFELHLELPIPFMKPSKPQLINYISKKSIYPYTRDMNQLFILVMIILYMMQQEMNEVITSSCLTNCLAVGEDTMMCRAVGEIKPSSTALSMKLNKEL